MKRLSVRKCGDRSFRVGRGKIHIPVTASSAQQALKLGKQQLRSEGKLDEIARQPRLCDLKAS